MKIILLLLFIFIVIYLFKKNIRESFKSTGDTQASVDKEIYDYNLEQALAIWNKVGGTNGTYKPKDSNRDLWAHEEWQKEIKAYLDEAEKYNKEHNWYDYSPGRGPEIYIKRKDYRREKISPIGIREAHKRIHGEDLGAYRYPKLGDRVRIKRSDNTRDNPTDADYYMGIVISKYGWIRKVLWDYKGKRNEGNRKPKRRIKTRGMPGHVRDKRVKDSGEDFGWPYWKWERHYNDSKQWDYITPSTWLKTKAVSGSWGRYGWFSRRMLYKVVECKKKDTTGCDYLRCDKRKEAVLNDYPITYHCAGDPRNRHPGVWKCDGGSKDGSFYNYYDKNTMCKNDFVRGKKNSFCVQDCTGKCVKTTLSDEISKQTSKSDGCAYLVSDHPTVINKGNYMLLDNETPYYNPTTTDKFINDGYKFRHCANEWGKCKFDGRATIMYGSIPIPGFLSTTRVLGKEGEKNQTVWCTNGTFGDPSKGNKKQCWVFEPKNERQGYKSVLNKNILKDGIIKSMKVFGNKCKFKSGDKEYHTGFHRNLNLKWGNTACGMKGSSVTAWAGCIDGSSYGSHHYRYVFQDRQNCLDKCKNTKYSNDGCHEIKLHLDGRYNNGCGLAKYNNKGSGRKEDDIGLVRRGHVPENSSNLWPGEVRYFQKFREWADQGNDKYSNGWGNTWFKEKGADVKNGKVTERDYEDWVNSGLEDHQHHECDSVGAVNTKCKRFRDYRRRGSSGYWAGRKSTNSARGADAQVNAEFVPAE